MNEEERRRAAKRLGIRPVDLERRPNDYSSIEETVEYTITGGISPLDLISIAGFDPETVDSRITNELFPVGRHYNLHRRLSLLRFHMSVRVDEALERFSDYWLEPLIFENALYFGILFKNLHLKYGHIAFLHEPVPGLDGDPSVLTLTKRTLKRLGIKLALAEPACRWPEGSLFAAVARTEI